MKTKTEMNGNMTMKTTDNIPEPDRIINVNNLSSHNADIIIELNHIHHELSHDDEARSDYVYHHNDKIKHCMELLKQLAINDDYMMFMNNDAHAGLRVGTENNEAHSAIDNKSSLIANEHADVNFTWSEFKNLINTDGKTREMNDDIMPNVGWLNYEIIRNNIIIDNARVITPRKYLLMGLLSTYDGMICVDPDDGLLVKIDNLIYRYALSSEAAYNGLIMLIRGYPREYVWEQVKIGSYDEIKAYMRQYEQSDANDDK